MATRLLQRFCLAASLIASVAFVIEISEIGRLQSWSSSRTTTFTFERKDQAPTRNESATNTTTTVWCVLDSNNTLMFGHFPHAAQSLFPCWSYFERMRELHGNVSCGFWYRNWTRPEKGYDWQRPLMKVMGCIETTNQSLPMSTNDHHHYSHHIDLVGGFMIQDGNNNKTTVPDVHWFDRPQDAWTLRETVLRYFNMTVPLRPRPLPKNEMLRIGFVQRQARAKRVVLNMDEIIAALQKVYPDAVFSNTTLDGMNLGEQAQYFASHDIILSGHGAALTNCVFLQPGSLVVQLYPTNYYPIFFFEPLIRQVKSHAFAWYDGHPDDPLPVFLLHLPQRFRSRAANMRPPVDEFVSLVVNATKNIGLF